MLKLSERSHKSELQLNQTVMACIFQYAKELYYYYYYDNNNNLLISFKEMITLSHHLQHT
jgi:hypothetical protein